MHPGAGSKRCSRSTSSRSRCPAGSGARLGLEPALGGVRRHAAHVRRRLHRLRRGGGRSWSWCPSEDPPPRGRARARPRASARRRPATCRSRPAAAPPARAAEAAPSSSWWCRSEDPPPQPRARAPAPAAARPARARAVARWSWWWAEAGRLGGGSGWMRRRRLGGRRGLEPALRGVCRHPANVRRRRRGCGRRGSAAARAGVRRPCGGGGEGDGQGGPEHGGADHPRARAHARDDQLCRLTGAHSSARSPGPVLPKRQSARTSSASCG